MWSINLEAINWLAVLVAAVASFLIGGVWYAVLFAKAWQRAHGFTDQQAKALSANPARTFGILSACDLGAALIMAILVQKTAAATVIDGLALGFWCWLLAMSAFVLSTYTASGKSLCLALIDGGKIGVCLAVMAVILAAWR